MRTPLDMYDDMPKDMHRYISHYGFHFTKRAYEYAVSFMEKRDPKTNKKVKVEPYTKQQVDDLLSKFAINIDNKVMYDYVFVATMCKADYLGSSIPDELHLALFVKDTVDDVDADDTTTFRRWMQTMIGNGTPIDWSELV